ncbi:MAG: DUF4197 domain-containing protein [Candidatus Dadabacteria bacterium]
MKKLFIPILFAVLIPTSFSCSTLKNYTLNEADATAAIRQLLSLGTNSSLTGAFSKEMIMATLFPESVRKALNTLDQLGLTSEVDRFTTTLSTAAEASAQRSVPIMVNAITGMRITDAIRLVRAGGTAATDYLRATAGADVRRAITPVMADALQQYKLVDQWNKLISPVKSLFGNRVNIDLPTLTAGMVSEAMFRKIAEKEQEVRNNASARTTRLLRQVFAGNYR